MANPRNSPEWFASLLAVPMVRMAETIDEEPLDPLDAELYTEIDIADIRAFWAEANPDADGMLDARPYEDAAVE